MGSIAPEGFSCRNTLVGWKVGWWQKDKRTLKQGPDRAATFLFLFLVNFAICGLLRGNIADPFVWHGVLTLFLGLLILLDLWLLIEWLDSPEKRIDQTFVEMTFEPDRLVIDKRLELGWHFPPGESPVPLPLAAVNHFRFIVIPRVKIRDIRPVGNPEDGCEFLFDGTIDRQIPEKYVFPRLQEKTGWVEENLFAWWKSDWKDFSEPRRKEVSRRISDKWKNWNGSLETAFEASGLSFSLDEEADFNWDWFYQAIRNPDEKGRFIALLDPSSWNDRWQWMVGVGLLSLLLGFACMDLDWTPHLRNMWLGLGVWAVFTLVAFLIYRGLPVRFRPIPPSVIADRDFFFLHSGLDSVFIFFPWNGRFEYSIGNPEESGGRKWVVAIQRPEGTVRIPFQDAKEVERWETFLRGVTGEKPSEAKKAGVGEPCCTKPKTVSWFFLIRKWLSILQWGTFPPEEFRAMLRCGLLLMFGVWGVNQALQDFRLGVSAVREQTCDGFWRWNRFSWFGAERMSVRNFFHPFGKT